jgi:hypothetical protein
MSCGLLYIARLAPFELLRSLEIPTGRANVRASPIVFQGSRRVEQSRATPEPSSPPEPGVRHRTRERSRFAESGDPPHDRDLTRTFSAPVASSINAE